MEKEEIKRAGCGRRGVSLKPGYYFSRREYHEMDESQGYCIPKKPENYKTSFIFISPPTC